MTLRFLLTANLLVPLALLGACRADFEGLRTLEVDALVALRTARPGLVVCDANNAKTRQEFGVIPGAVLLSDYRDYAPDELPADHAQTLVFYCHSEMCGAAGDAARAAVTAGHEDVRVLRHGIRGWVAAGQPVELEV